MPTAQFDWFPCSFFLIGNVQVTPDIHNLVSDEEITLALTRHAHCDFGQVCHGHHLGNLQSIADSQGVVTSIYHSAAGATFHVMTWLDDFEPRTLVLVP